MFEYTPLQWMLIFYLYCFFGWIFESTVVSVQQRRPVNRGFLHGPMLPIYGFGALIMLHIAHLLNGHPVALFFAGMIIATAFEYVVGLLLETIFKMRYWDYSTHRFQFQGRICLQSSLAWGALSLALPYFIHRPVVAILNALDPLATALLTGGLTVYFVWDTIDSVRAAFDVARAIEELDRVRVEAEALRRELAAQAADVRQQLSQAADELRARADAYSDETREQLSLATDEFRTQMAARRDAIRQSAEQRRLQLHLGLREAEARADALADSLRTSRKWLVRGNPTLRSVRFEKAADELRRRLKRR